MSRVVYARVQRGMTLIEVMVALALLSLLSVGIVTAFRLGEHTYRQITEAVTADQEVMGTQRFVRQIIESAHPFQQLEGERTAVFGLEGTSNQLALTAPMPQSSGAGGNYRYELIEVTGDHGLKRLTVRWTLDRHGSQGIAPVFTIGAPQEEVLLEGVESVEWGYQGFAEAHESSVTMESRWSTSWTGPKPPALVRLRVNFPAGSRRHWPELIISPFATDDPECQFDVVSQTCREI